jgi:hypothetical protein
MWHKGNMATGTLPHHVLTAMVLANSVACCAESCAALVLSMVLTKSYSTKKRSVPFLGPCLSKIIRKNPNNFTDLH